VRDKTWFRYEQIVRLHVSPALGRYRVNALRPFHLQKFYAAKQQAGLSPRTVLHIHRALHRALALGVRWGVVTRNVAAAVDPPQVRKKELVLPTIQEMNHLLDVAWEHGDRLAPLWTVAVYTGCREGELLALQWSDIDLDSGELSVRRTLARVKAGVPQFGEPKTNLSRRNIALPPEAVDALRKWRVQQNEERLVLGPDYADYGLVFSTQIGTALMPRNVIRSFKAALARAGLPRQIRIHDLRHFAATLMLAAGVHPKVASERLGHSQIGITLDLYSHAVKGLDVDAAERMQRALRGAP
jgi:integrase